MRKFLFQILFTGMVSVTVLLAAHPALGQSFSLDLGQGPSSTGRIIQLFILITVLSLAPSILVMVTSFTRIVVVLSFLTNSNGNPANPAQSGDDQPCPLPHDLHHDADARKILGTRRTPLHRR